jgi:hypothetical protein
MSSPSNIVVLRIETHRVRDADVEYDLRWRVLGTLQDLNWDRAEPLKLGPQQPYVYLMDAKTFGLSPDDCLAYLKAEQAWCALIREEAFNYGGCTVYSSLREAEEEIMGYIGEKIDAAIGAYFEEEPAAQAEAAPVVETKVEEQKQPPWAGLYSKEPSDPTGADLYI